MNDARAGDDQTRRLYLAKGLSVPSPLPALSSEEIFFILYFQIGQAYPEGGEGVIPYIGYTGMCHWKGYGFQVI